MMRCEEGETHAAVKQRKGEEEEQSPEVDDFGGSAPETRHREEFEIDDDDAGSEG